MNNTYKKITLILSLLALSTTSSFLIATESSPKSDLQEKGLMKDAEKKLMDKYYKKKTAKILKKLKKAATPEVQEEIIKQIANSNLTDEHKTLAVDALEKGKAELNIESPTEETPAQDEISEEIAE